MREILFRGKSITTDSPNTPGYWLEGSLVHQTEHYGDPVDIYHIVKLGNFQYDYYESEEVWAQTIGQFTGFFDKNGKRIFEGDIVLYKSAYKFLSFSEIESAESIHNRKCVIKYENGKFSPLPYREDCDDYWYSHGAFDFEVIGNIHDNPELLEESK